MKKIALFILSMMMLGTLCACGNANVSATPAATIEATATVSEAPVAPEATEAPAETTAPTEEPVAASRYEDIAWGENDLCAVAYLGYGQDLRDAALARYAEKYAFAAESNYTWVLGTGAELYMVIPRYEDNELVIESQTVGEDGSLVVDETMYDGADDVLMSVNPSDLYPEAKVTLRSQGRELVFELSLSLKGEGELLNPLPEGVLDISMEPMAVGEAKLENGVQLVWMQDYDAEIGDSLVEPVEMISMSDSARIAELKALGYPTDEWMFYNDYEMIAYPEQSARLFVDKAVSVKLIDYEQGIEALPVELSALAEGIRANGGNLLCNITTVDGVITAIEQVFVP